jgi:hypothetical protein
MAQALDIISRALKDIGALEAGEAPGPDSVQDAFEMLNDLIDQWSNEEMMIFNVTEIIFPVIPGQTQYTIGPNPSTQNFIGASFTGSITGNVLTVTGITSGAVAQGQTLEQAITNAAPSLISSGIMSQVDMGNLPDVIKNNPGSSIDFNLGVGLN